MLAQTISPTTCYFIKSKPNNTLAENAIRSTWATGNTYFVHQNNTDKQSDYIILEAGFPERYKWLNRKSALFWRYASRNKDLLAKCKWFFYTDDDAYVHTKMAEAYLHRIDERREIYSGLLHFQFGKNPSVSMAQGHGIILSNALVHRMDDIIKRCQKYDYAENVHNEDCMLGTCMLFHGIRPQYLFSIYSGVMESGKSNQLNYHHSEQSVVESSLRRVKDFSCTVLSCCMKRPGFMIELHQRVISMSERSTKECLQEYIEKYAPIENLWEFRDFDDSKMLYLEIKDKFESER